MIIHSPIFSGSITQAESAYANLSGSFTGSFTGVGNFVGLEADSVAYENVTGKPALVSGSSQVSYPNLSNIPSGIISSSAQIDVLFNIDGLISGSSQVSYPGLSNIPSGIVSGSSQVTPLLPTGVISGSSQVVYTSLSSIPAGIVSGSTQVQFNDITNNPFSSSASNITITAGKKIRSSDENTIIIAENIDVEGNITLLGAVDGVDIAAFKGDFDAFKVKTFVTGSSQVSYPSLSNIPSGIVSGSSQLSGTTITDLTIVNLTTVNETASVIFSSGSNRFGDFGNDTHSFTGSVQVSGSFTLIGTSTATSYNGTINATNGVVSGSAQIDGSLLGSNKTITIGSTSTTLGGTSTTIAGLTSVTSTTFVGALTGNASTATTLATARTINGTSFNGGADITIPNLVSGSSQITLSSTTGYGTVINQNLLTTSNVQHNSLGIGMAASATAGRIDATNDVVAYSSSDIRFKENIKPIENALEKISKISGNTYDWKEENKIEHGYEGNDVGVIAQEIEAVLPQLVQTRESGFKAVKYDKLVALLIEGIKEQQKQIDELKSRLS
jgi:hypothetical protein